MNTTSNTPDNANGGGNSRRIRSSRMPQSATPAVQGSTVIERNYDGMTQQAPVVEHLTIPGFLRRLDHRWSMEDIRRFGHKVGVMAETMHLAYVTTMDASLGQLRCFPKPMMDRIYNNERQQFGWPELPDGDAASEEIQQARQKLKSLEKTAQTIRSTIESTEDVGALEDYQKTLARIEAAIVQLKAICAAPTLPRG